MASKISRKFLTNMRQNLGREVEYYKDKANKAHEDALRCKRQLSVLLMQNANQFSMPISRTRSGDSNLENRLRNEGFRVKHIKLVASKMRKSGRPSSNYSKTTGKLKQ